MLLKQIITMISYVVGKIKCYYHNARGHLEGRMGDSERCNLPSWPQYTYKTYISIVFLRIKFAYNYYTPNTQISRGKYSNSVNIILHTVAPIFAEASKTSLFFGTIFWVLSDLLPYRYVEMLGRSIQNVEKSFLCWLIDLYLQPD